MNNTSPQRASILINISLPEPEPLSPVLVEMMQSLSVILVGWYLVPEQTNPEQARNQFGEEAEEALEDVANQLRRAGALVESHLVFTADELDTIERIAAERNSDAILLPAPVNYLGRILVPIRGTRNADRIAHFVADLVQDGTTDVTLLHVVADHDQADRARIHVLHEVARMMKDEGLDAGLIQQHVDVADEPGDAILDYARDYDLVVIGETKPSVREIIFGTVPEELVEATNVPVILVRKGDAS